MTIYILKEIIPSVEKWEKDFLDYVFGNENVKVKATGSICSTCKHFNGKSYCAKNKSFGGFATKLSDCNEWEVCGG